MTQQSGRPQPIEERLAAVRLLAMDVDGVLTDGGIFLSGPEGESKRFHVQDGLGDGIPHEDASPVVRGHDGVAVGRPGHGQDRLGVLQEGGPGLAGRGEGRTQVLEGE